MSNEMDSIAQYILFLLNRLCCTILQITLSAISFVYEIGMLTPQFLTRWRRKRFHLVTH